MSQYKILAIFGMIFLVLSIGLVYAYSAPSYWNVTLSFEESYTAPSYTNVTLTFSEEEVIIDSCTYTSGNWNIICSDNCSITESVDLEGNNITLSDDVGTFNIKANITTFNKIIKYDNCQINIFSGKLIK